MISRVIIPANVNNNRFWDANFNYVWHEKVEVFIIKRIELHGDILEVYSLRENLRSMMISFLIW